MEGASWHHVSVNSVAFEESVLIERFRRSELEFIKQNKAQMENNKLSRTCIVLERLRLPDRIMPAADIIFWPIR